MMRKAITAVASRRQFEGAPVSAAPALSSINPSEGDAAGGESAEITGEGFVDSGETITGITFGGSAVDMQTVSVSDDATILINHGTPAHAAGQVSVVVTFSTTGALSLDNSWDYV